MPYIIRNAKGEICGRCTNRPGPGNKLPDGSIEQVEFIEEDTPEVLAFFEAQAARIAVRRDPLADLKAALIAKGVITEQDVSASKSK